MKYHHFRISSSSPGVVFMKEHSDSPEVKFTMLKQPWSPSKDDLPDIVPPRVSNANGISLITFVHTVQTTLKSTKAR